MNNLKEKIEKIRNIAELDVDNEYKEGYLKALSNVIAIVDENYQEPYSWIKVEDGLPEKRKPYTKYSDKVLVYTSQGIFTTKYSFEGKDWYLMPHKVTHWHYLPIPPTKNKYVKCFDKFEVELKEGDIVDVQMDGEHEIYKKENGQLYFKPYGKEDRVCTYFSNDMIKVKR